MPRLGFVLSIVLALVIGGARAASAEPLAFSGAISLTSRLADTTAALPFGTALLSASGLHLTQASVPQIVAGIATAVVDVTDPAARPIYGIQMTPGIGGGAVTETAGGKLSGPLPVRGFYKVCMFGPCSAAVANMVLPLSAVGAGGSKNVTAAVNLTLVGAPWTTGTVAIGTVTAMGSRGGPAGATSTTAQLGGQLNLVSPTFLSTNIAPYAALPVLARLSLLFSEAPAACANGLDDDGDGLADFPGDPGCASVGDDSETDAALVCDNGIDDDGDDLIDFPDDPGCADPSDPSEIAVCQNGLDDDGDGLADFPDDPGCTSANDGSERQAGHSCDDGLDNDGDGQTDFPADPGCSSALDETESSLLACDDGLDNDGDGAIDLADPGCASSLDDSERGAAFACDDGVDNDGDGVADFPDDPGCTSATGTSEVGQCQDGLDNDGDELVDFPADPDCGAASDPTENPAPECSDGSDNDGDGAIDYPADPECASPTDATERDLVRWDVAQGGNGHFYELVNTLSTWAAARLAAAQRTPPTGYGPGHLATIASAAEDSFLATTFGRTGWIGFTDEAVEGEWRWIDDTPGIWQDPDNFPSPIQTAYVDWASGEPNNLGDEDYALFAYHGLQWNDGRGSDGTFPNYVEYELPICDNQVDDDGDGLADFPDDPGCTSATDDSERDPSLICDDGIDNDGDGLGDFPNDPGCTSADDESENDAALVCDNGIDDDGDDLIDFPDDPGCADPSDPSEIADCQNGLDDDGDGLADFPDDPGCTSAADTSEHQAGLACDDAADNDGDGAADYPADPGCSSVLDETESSLLACDDGLDNDGDGAIDLADPGCASSLDDSERGAAFACDDGVDNDGDGVADFPDDPGCTSATGASEVGQCQDGLDNDGDELVDFPADPDCGSASDPVESPNPECSDGIDNDGDGAIDYPADAQCTSASDISETAAVRWEIAQGGNGHFYEVVTAPLSWTDARPAAGQRTPPTGYGPGHLASFSSAAEEAFVDSVLGNAEGWIGFTDEVVEGEWRWIDATPGIWQDPRFFATPIQTAYVNWASGEPNDVTHQENYALFGWSGIRWNDGADYPALVRPYYVEYEPAGPACSNNVDDDGDRLADHPNDPGCASADDESEHDPALVCDNGLDDDGDGRTDFPADPDCESPTDGNEQRVADCEDGLDNDGDGLVDLADPGCPVAYSEPENPPCDDGLDNDGDGATDFEDSSCSASWPYWERNSLCGLGAELVLVVPLLGWLRGRRRGRRILG